MLDSALVCYLFVKNLLLQMKTPQQTTPGLDFFTSTAHSNKTTIQRHKKVNLAQHPMYPSFLFNHLHQQDWHN